MAGYASQNDYEADLLQTYLKKGRVSPISRRDVDLALSIYKMPDVAGLTGRKKTITAATAKASAKGKTDSQIMRVAIRAVLNKNLADRAAARKAKAAGASAGSIPAPTRAPTVSVPAAPPPTAYNSYSGPLTAATEVRSGAAPQPPRPKASTYKPRRGQGGGYRAF